MPKQKYATPPILEAIMEIRWQDEISLEVLEKAGKKLSKRFPQVETELKFNMQFGDGSFEWSQKAQGRKLTSSDGLEVVLLRPQSLTVARLSPYEGWDEFFIKAKPVFETVRKVTRYKKIVRASVRYVNRIDIPTVNKIDTDDYLTVGLTVPKQDFPALDDYNLSFRITLDDGIRAIVASRIAQPEILDHMAIMLDLDVFADRNVPQKEPDLWDLFTRLRSYKNDLFEKFITEKTRTLFEERKPT